MTSQSACAIVLAALGVLVVAQVGVSAPGVGRLVLHPGLGRVQVERAVLDVLVDLLGRLQEHVLDILARLRRSFEEQQPVLVRELLGFLVSDVPLSIKVSLVANEEDYLEVCRTLRYVSVITLRILF